MVDVVIVGGGAAGLSAGLMLGRARRRTVIVDAGRPRNAPSPSAHNFFTRDGTPPAELLRTGREQLERYDTVELRFTEALDARRTSAGFDVQLQDAVISTRAVLLAHGVVDELPAIDGVRELWGTSVLHCPYCHGWEVRDEPLAVYGRGEAAMEFVQLLWGWSHDLVLCTDGPAGLGDAQRTMLARRGVQVREERLVRLAAADGILEHIIFAEGSELARRAMFMRPSQRLSTDLAARLGCDLTDAGLIRTDEWGETSEPGVYAAGDITSPMQQIGRAAAAGAAAAGRINHFLTAQDFG